MLRLVIGNKNYSSWSLRPWLALTEAGIAFEEIPVSLFAPDSAALIRRYSPTGRIPVLIDDAVAKTPLTIWDSLAICEYLAEIHPHRGLWPADRVARAHARSLCAEMHSGFTTLRMTMPMNIRAELPGCGWNVAVQADVDRLVAMWRECLVGSGGPLLFGGFSIADAFFAPVVTRFRTYAVDVPDDIAAYCERVLALPGMQAWERTARAEPESIAASELYRRSARPSPI